MADKDFEQGERVVLGTRDNSSMTKFRWSGNEPTSLHEVEWAEELGAEWEGDELVIYDYPGFVGLLDMYERGEYTIDND
jgi:hypothetical protein